MEAIEKIETAIQRRKDKLKTGHLPGMWNHFPHDDADYRNNKLRSEMNGLELALWILRDGKGMPKKWG